MEPPAQPSSQCKRTLAMSRTPSVISVASLAPSQRSTVSPTGNLHTWQRPGLSRVSACHHAITRQAASAPECTHATRRSVLWNALSCTRASQLGHRIVGL